MKSKKLPKPTKKDRDWQEKIEERSRAEKVDLGHPEGKERFKRAIKNVIKKKPAK